MNNPILSDVLTVDDGWGNIPARIEDTIPTGYRLVNRDGVLTLQGYVRWYEGVLSGGNWKDIPTVIEGSN